MSEPVWIGCEEIGCARGITVHYRHVDNFAGRYVCTDHNQLTEDE